MKQVLFVLAALVATACATAPNKPAPPPADPLMNTTWTQTGVEGRAPTIEFGTDHERAAGFGGCNRWFSTLTHEDDKTRFVAVGSTRMMCEGPAMETEQAFFAMLERTRQVERRGNVLVLKGEAGDDIARFTQSPN